MVSNGTVGGSEHRGARSGGVGGPNNIVDSVTSVAGTTKGLSHLTAVVKGSGVVVLESSLAQVPSLALWHL